jgi:hypothetical protein
MIQCGLDVIKEVDTMDGLFCKKCGKALRPGTRGLGLKEDGSFNWYHNGCAQEIGLLHKHPRRSSQKGKAIYERVLKASKVRYTEDDIRAIKATLALPPEERLKRAVSMIVPMSSPLFHRKELLNDEH